MAWSLDARAALRRALPLLACVASAAVSAEQPAAPAKRIVDTEKNLYSHDKEELIIRDFFQDRRGGVFLDVGCYHPVKDSNTYYLEKHLGWSGIGVDALPELAPKWEQKRPASKFFNFLVSDHADTVDAFYRAASPGVSSIDNSGTGPAGRPMKAEKIMVPSTTLTALLERSGVSKVDFVSMDIEGAEPLALAGFDIGRFRPELVCIEAKVKTRAAITKYFAEHGYRRLEQYLKYDQTNYYYAPASGVR